MIQARLFLMMLLQLAIWGAYMPKLYPYMLAVRDLRVAMLLAQLVMSASMQRVQRQT